MVKDMREQVIKAIENEKLITIVRGVKREKLIDLAQAMYDGGVRLLELTFDSTGKVSDKETAENINALVKNFEGKMYIGAGTVLTKKQVELTKNAGGTFIISPDTYKEVIEKTRELEMVSIPGALTPSEIQSAIRFGADFVKLFPITSLGVDYVKAVKAPLSHVKILAVGGVNENNISSYLNAGVSGFGISSNIVDKQLVNSGEFDKITLLAKNFVSVIKG